jgi:hypothetical protein
MYESLVWDALVFRGKSDSAEVDRALRLYYDSPEGLRIYPLHEQVHRALVLPDATLLKVLERVAVDNITLVTTINHYEDAGYGDMLRDVRNNLSGDDRNKAMRLLHGGTPLFKCVPGEHEMLLEAKSIAMSMARNAALLIGADFKAGRVSPKVKTAFDHHFNPGNKQILYFKHLRKIENVLLSTWANMLRPVAFRCLQESHRDYPIFDCEKHSAYTYSGSMKTIFICPSFWQRFAPTEKGRVVLHEFVHHQHKHDDPEGEWITDRAYGHEGKYAKLTPQKKGSSSDSLSNADSYANFAWELY